MSNSKDKRLIALMIIGVIINGIDAKPPSRIVNGEDTGATEFTFVVRVFLTRETGGTTFCSGAIISPRHVITAGHCLHGKIKAVVYSSFKVIDDPEVVITPVSKMIPHPKYVPQDPKTGQGLFNDLGILVLEKELVFDAKQSQIPLTKEEPGINSFAFVAGWGNIERDTSSRKVHKLSVRILEKSECEKNGGYDETPEKLCAFNEMASTCGGDSGAPLVSRGHLIGVVSASSCTPGRTTSFANIHHYYDWITSTMART